MFSRSFHQYSWNSEVETTWKRLICWRHRTSIKKPYFGVHIWWNDTYFLRNISRLIHIQFVSLFCFFSKNWFFFLFFHCSTKPTWKSLLKDVYMENYKRSTRQFMKSRLVRVQVLYNFENIVYNAWYTLLQKIRAK